MKIIGKVLVVFGFAAGCGTSDAVEEACHRAQQCNYLPSGASESDCVDVFHRCTDELTSSQRSDWERKMNSCLQNQSCSLFANCWDDVPWC